MKSKLVIIACLFGLLVLACGDKGTDPPEEPPRYKTALVNAFVRDSIGQPAPDAMIISKLYFLSDSIPGMDVVWADEFGYCQFYIAVRNISGKDTVLMYAAKPELELFSDTAIFVINNSGQVFNVELTLSD